MTHPSTVTRALAGILLTACSTPGTSASDGAASDLTGAATADGAVSPWQLVWSDEFNGADGTGPDPSKWVFETGGGGWGNGELEDYTSRTSNAVVQQGHLVITAQKESYQGSAYTSARMKTAGKFAFTYGRLEMSAVLPQGQGLWPAFWMLGANIDTGTAWPGCGEIDIMEFVGKTPTRIYGTIHGPGYSGANGVGAWHDAPPGFSGGYHQYALEWDPGAIRWYFDGALYEERTVQDIGSDTWVFDHDFFILLNLAVGGAFPGAPDATTVFPQRYTIDYVRVYQRTGAAPPPPARTLWQLQARDSGKFVSADKDNGDQLLPNRASAGTWETFVPQALAPGQSAQTALLALSEYKYVTVTASGALLATSETIGASETFTVVSNADGSRALRSAASGKYVTFPTTGTVAQASAATVTASEELNLIVR